MSETTSATTSTSASNLSSGRNSPRFVPPSHLAQAPGIPIANAQKSATTAANMATTGPNSLPIVGNKGAPKKFKGRYDEVKNFIRHYKRLCAQKSVTDDQDKIENITQYCSQDVREFMEGLPSYNQHNWQAFSQDVLKYYDAEKDARRYRIRDLESYVMNTRTLPKFKDLATWKRYSRGYIRIAGWLQKHGKLDEKNNNLYF